MNTEKTPTIYGGVTFEQFSDAIETVCKYVDGPIEPAQAEPGNTYGPKTENL